MAFCTNCGKEIADDAKFCQHCGVPFSIPPADKTARRKQEYIGSVKKCPACGMELPSLTAVCPGCGHEINDGEVSESLMAFVSQLEACDKQIASCTETPKRGWASWGIIKKCTWIILNLCFCFLPLGVYLIWKLWKMCRTPVLTIDERNKAGMIENYLFPDNRGTILEVLLFIKAKVDFLADQRADANHVYWAHLWKKKAEQLYHRAELLFPGDLVAHDTYQEIVSSNELVWKKLRKKILMIGGAIAVVIVLTTVGRSVFSPFREHRVLLEWPETGLAQSIPAIEAKYGEITFNTDELYMVRVRDFSDSEYENYIEACKESGFTVEVNRKSASYEAFNKEGCHLQLLHTASNNQLDIHLHAAMEMSHFVWPKSEIAKLLPVPESAIGNIEWEADDGFAIYVGGMTKEQYKAYVDTCFEHGFTEGYRRGEDYFHAKNLDGYNVNIDYRGFNTMSVRIDAPD